MSESILKNKIYGFAVLIVRLVHKIQNDKKEFVLTKQILRSGTAIGALIREAEFGQSKADFINKLNISLKEANETSYWLLLMKDTDYIDNSEFQNLQKICLELIAMLVSSIKTAKKQ